MKQNNNILILPPRYTEDSISLWKEASQNGWYVERLQRWITPDWISQNPQQVTIYGEPLFAAVIADQIGISLIEPPLNWVSLLPYEYTKRKIHFTNFESARTIEDNCFFKPADDKAFEAKVYKSGQELPDNVDPNIPVLISEVVEWKVEFRAFILEKKVITISPYWREGKLAKDENGLWPYQNDEEQRAKSFCEKVLKDKKVHIPPAVVMDVGLFTNGEWAVVEANPCWGSGIYGCHPLDVLKVLQRACLYTPSEDDTNWILKRE